MRTLLVLLTVSLTHPLHAQPIPVGDEVRVREPKGASWATGTLARSDSMSMVLTQCGVERAHEFLTLERIEWKAPRNIPLELLLGTAGGALIGLGVELFSLWLTSACYPSLSVEGTGECNEDWGKAAGIGAAAGASWVLLTYAISPRRWNNVTKHYRSAGANR